MKLDKLLSFSFLNKIKLFEKKEKYVENVFIGEISLCKSFKLIDFDLDTLKEKLKNESDLKVDYIINNENEKFENILIKKNILELINNYEKIVFVYKDNCGFNRKINFNKFSHLIETSSDVISIKFLFYYSFEDKIGIEELKKFELLYIDFI